MWASDILHVVDLHGVSAHAVGNLLADVIRDTELRDCHTHAESLEFLNTHLAAYYSRVEETDRIGELSSSDACVKLALWSGRRLRF